MVDPDLLDTILDGNIVVIISEEGETTFILNEEKILDNPKQAKQFARLYICLEEPSWVLRSVIALETFFLYAWTTLTYWWDRMLGREED